MRLGIGGDEQILNSQNYVPDGGALFGKTEDEIFFLGVPSLPMTVTSSSSPENLLIITVSHRAEFML